MTSTWKDSEWRTSFLANLLSMNPGGVAVDLAKLLKGIKDEDERQAVEHTKGILESLNDDPLPIDPDLKLWEIYVPPSVRYWSPDNKDKNERDKAGELLNLFASLLGTIEDSDAPIVIHGQPGHGKTSSVKMLTHAIATKEQEEKRKKRTHVLMYEFKFLRRLDDNEIQVLSRWTPFLKNESFFHGKNTVLILDGLDERQITDGSDYALKDFVRLMFRLAENINKRDDSKLNLILTGRSQFVRQVRNAFTGPYHQYEIRDFTEEQVGAWLGKYCAIKKIEPGLKYEDFESKKLRDLIHQPILLTISAMMLADETGRRLIEDLGDREITRGDIYQIIIQWTYERKWQCHPNCAHLPDAASYRKFLRILAFILFRHGEEAIKISTLIEALKKHNTLYDLEWIKTKSDETIDDICKNVAVSFFFKGLEENAFSFIHKTVRDYLTVEAIFDLLKEATENFNPRRPEKSCDNMAEDIYFILGKSKLSYEDHLPFLEDVIAARNAEVKKLFDPLEAFFKLAQDHIFLIRHEGGQNVNPLITEANVLSGLLYWITEIFQTFSEEERKEKYLQIFKLPNGFYEFISFLHSTELFGYPLNFKLKFKNLIGANLVRANLENTNLSSANLENADLSSANLEKADLSDANLEKADLSDANLGKADLSDANLEKADLSDANLGKADLSGANLEKADLSGANLEKADLSGANLEKADLSGAYLRWADLKDVNLQRVNLEKANLNGANLEKADLSGAYLRWADLGGAYLKNADLSDANLEEASLISANLKEVNLSDTYLSDANLKKADLRDANLGKANLSGANLEKANLSGANLGKTNLSSANLEETNLEEANLEEANLIGANLEKANLIGANLEKANLIGVSLNGADLRYANLKTAKCLTFQQIKQAITDETTILPDYLKQEDEAEDTE